MVLKTLHQQNLNAAALVLHLNIITIVHSLNLVALVSRSC